jgi:hypothetical protein
MLGRGAAECVEVGENGTVAMLCLAVCDLVGTYVGLAGCEAELDEGIAWGGSIIGDLDRLRDTRVRDRLRERPRRILDAIAPKKFSSTGEVGLVAP